MLLPTKPNRPFLPFNCHPLYLATIMFMIGIASDYYCFPSKIPLYFGAIFTGLTFINALFANQFYRHTRHKTISIFALSASIGLFLGCMRMHQQHDYTKHTAQMLPRDLCTVKAIVRDIAYPDHATIRASITLQAIEIHGATTNETDLPPPVLPLNRTFLWYSAQKPQMCVGDTVSIRNVKLKAAGTDDFGRYLLKEGMSATFFTAHPDYTVVDHPTWSYARTIYDYRAKTFAALKSKLSPKTFSLFSSLFLGNRTVGKKYLLNIAEQFRLWGISHQLARSGLHLVIFSFACDYLLHYLPIPFFCRQLALLLLGLVYYALSWSSISFIRAFLSFMAYRLCAMILVPAHVIYILSLICFLVLFYNPVQLFFLDFQLSFLLTFALAWFGQLYSPYKID